MWLRRLRRLGGIILKSYLLTLLVCIAIAPLAAAHYHLVSPIGVLLGPPLILLTAIALVAGFLLLAAAALCPPLTAIVAPVLYGSLTACQFLVDQCDGWPFARFYVGDVPAWWLWIFYVPLMALLTQRRLRRRWRWGITAGLGWLCVGLLCAAVRLPSDELRCTFLAVGHGGCTVMETADGRTLLYDAERSAALMWHGDKSRRFMASRHSPHRRGVAIARRPRPLQRLARTARPLRRRTSDLYANLHGQADRGRSTNDGSVTETRHPGAHRQSRRRAKSERCSAAGSASAGGRAGGQREYTEYGVGSATRRPYAVADRRSGRAWIAAHIRIAAISDRYISSAASRQPVGQHPGVGRLGAAARGGVEPGTAAHARRRTRTVYGQRARFLSTWADGAITIRSHSTGMVVETFVTGQRFVLRTERGAE